MYLPEFVEEYVERDRTSRCTRCSRRTRRRTWSSAASSSAGRARTDCSRRRASRARSRAHRGGRAAGAREGLPHRHGALLRPVRRPAARVGPVRDRRGHAHRHAGAARVRRHPQGVGADEENELESRDAAERACRCGRRSSRTWCARSLDGAHTMIWPTAAAGGSSRRRSSALFALKDEGRDDRGHGGGDADAVRHRGEDPEHPAGRARRRGVGDDQRRDAADDDVGAGRGRGRRRAGRRWRGRRWTTRARTRSTSAATSSRSWCSC